MPELPEVETILRGLAPRLTGRRIEVAEIVAPLVVKTSLDGLAGTTIGGIRRHGKSIVFDCSSGVLSIHLGMTGKLLIDASPSPYARVVFHLDQGALIYDDIRQFGRIQFGAELPRSLAALGPDPLAITVEEFVARVRVRRGMIKPLLLNQNFLRGLGNIYVDECLFRAGIHPRTNVERLTKPRLAALHQAIQSTLALAIEHRGSSISDYVDADGERGGFQKLHAVYGKEDVACLNCGTAIQRIVIGQRGTHFCPRCQR